MTFVEYPKKLHHPERTEPSIVVRDEEEEAEALKRWNITPEEADLAIDNSRDMLLKRATKLDIRIDNRWSDHRLRRAVEEAEPK